MKTSVFSWKIAFLAVLFFFFLPSVFCQTYTLNQMYNPDPQSNHLTSVFAIDANNVFAVGENGAILKYDGTDWSKMSSPTTQYLNSVVGFSSSDVWAVGGEVVHYNGSSWSKVNIGSTEVLLSVFGLNGNSVYACGADAAFYHYNGSSWAKITDLTWALSSFRDVHVLAENDVYVVAVDNYSPYTTHLLHYAGGATLNEVTTLPNGVIAKSVWTNDGNVFLIPHQAGLYRYNKSSGTKEELSSVGACTELYAFNSNNIVGVGPGVSSVGTVVHYDGTNLVEWGQYDVCGVSSPNDPHNVFMVGFYGLIVHLDITSGVKENDLINDYSLYPNPSSGRASLEFSLNNPGEVVVEINDMCGKMVASIFSGSVFEPKQLSLELSDLPAGTYFLRIRSGQDVFTRKLILAK